MGAHRAGRASRLIFLFFALVLGVAGIAWLRGERERVAALKARQASWARLEQSLTDEIRRFQGHSGIVIEDLSTGWRFTHQPQKPFAAASVIKVPVMGACFTAEASGKLNLDDSVKLTASDQVSGSGVLKQEKPGTVLPVSRLLELMIGRSDNTATNMLLDKLGLDYCNRVFAQFGLEQTVLKRKMMDFSRRSQGVENYTTATDMAEVLGRIYRGKLVNAAYSERGLKWLKNQHLNDRIPAKLPKGTIVAHKTGLERSVCHDVGIVYTPRGDYLICVLTQHKGLSKPAKRFIAALSRQTYDYLTKS